MKKSALEEAETIPRKYGLMRMLAGGRNLNTIRGDLRILEIRRKHKTSLHYHKESESIFHVLSGDLEMEVDGVPVPVSSGDTIVIEPGEVHILRNIGTRDATVLETMAPPFSKKDIFYLDDSS